MKKLRCAFALLLCILLAVTCAFSVSAESVNYKLKDLNMSIKIPDTMAVKTRDNSSDLAEGIYLEATSSDGKLTISISMIENEKTQEIFSFMDLPTDTMMDYKEQMLKNDEYTDCTSGTYGGVPFLDFSLKFTAEGGLDVYGKQSVTLVNGKNISISSQSIGDNFTSDELSLIKGCLDTIRFTSIKSAPAEVNVWAIIIWVLVILIMLAAAFVALSYFMGKHSAQRKRDARRDRRRKADYDVLRNADEHNRRRNNSSSVGGFKTSNDYFDTDFEDVPPAKILVSEHSTSKEKALDVAEKAVKTTGTAFTHVGYFFTNLKREISKNKKAKKSSKKKVANRKNPRQSRDYDVFRDR